MIRQRIGPLFLIVLYASGVVAAREEKRPRRRRRGGGGFGVAEQDGFDKEAVATIARATLERVLALPDEGADAHVDGGPAAVAAVATDDGLGIGEGEGGDSGSAAAAADAMGEDSAASAPSSSSSSSGVGGVPIVDGSEGGETTTTTTTTATESDEKVVASTAAAAVEDEDVNISYDGSDLVAWINDNGGLVHKNARIGLDPTGRYRGVFVKTEEEGGTEEGIEEGEIIVRVPWDLIIKPKNYHVNRWWNCEAIHELYRQFILGDESKYAPYVNYLKNQPRGRIPDEWTDAGKQLLHTILDSRENDDEGLQPPTEKSYEETWIGECKGEDTPLARAAFYQFTSRDEDTLMVPFFDMSNHSNDPEKLNTAYPQRPKRPGQPFVLRSMRDIRPGEQVYISYNRCHRCWFDESYEDCELYSNYETNDVFQSFGFVEEFPQTWKFKMNVGDEEHPSWDLLKFCLTRDDSSSSGLVVRFGDNYTPDPESEIPTMGNVVYLGKQLMRLVELEATVKNDDKVMETMPKYEWEMAWTYHQALMTSISAALLASDIVNPAGSDDDSEESDYSEDNSEDWDEKDIDYDSGDEPDDEDERDEL